MRSKICFAFIALLILASCGSENKEDSLNKESDKAVNKKFILKASNMKYLVLAPDSSLVAMEVDPEKAIVFERIELENGKTTLKVSNGMFVCDDRSRNSVLYANRKSAGEWEMFDIIALDNLSVNIKSMTGKFVSCNPEPGSKAVADRDHGAEWETFILEQK